MVIFFYKKHAITSIAAISVIISILIISCDKSLETIPKDDILTLPFNTVKSVNTVFCDSGKMQLVLTAPILEQFKTTELEYSEFKSGIFVQFYDGNVDPVGTVTSKYAKYIDSKNMWELRDSVVVVNEDQEKLETELLYWYQQKDLIVTDRFVKITTKEQIVQGTGFESDSRLTKRKIRNISLIYYLNDEK